jgi:hypothetical protein
MEFSLVIVISLAVLVALVLLAAETVREFRRMDRKTSDYTGSDRLAGSAE